MPDSEVAGCAGILIGALIMLLLAALYLTLAG